MPIRVLAPEVVSKIAAGEVVERPASVVKELMDNSLDAGASQIDIEVRGGGVNFIRVSDNGVGIPQGEVELAFHRYATSKITSLADLEKTTSLGFRGEALPSIAQVAQVELLTRSREEMPGTYLCLREGASVERGVRASPQGTTVTVRNLFRNVPARLKFLKSSTTEDSHITDLVSQYSLAFPGVRFGLIIDGRRVLHTPGNGRLRDVLVQVYGLETAQAMLEIGKSDKEGGLAPAVSGYISPPSLSRAKRSYLSFFVNRRWIQSRLMVRAVEKAYEGLLMVGRYPIAAINLSLLPQWIDVNVHPTKREVRFSQESIIFNTVYGTVRRTLVERVPVPEVSLSPHPVFTPEQQPLEGPSDDKKPGFVLPLIPHVAPSGLPVLRVLGQLGNTYIIAEGPDGLYLIDQHAAHERILFEKILTQWAQRGVEIQSLLEPLTIELSLKQEELLGAKGEMLAQFGFTIEPFGDRTYLLRAVPAILGGRGISEAVKETIDSLEGEATPAKGEERVALSLACHSAVRAGQTLDPEEMRELVKQLEKATSPRNCPHGRPTMVHLSSGRLEKEFGRI
jgi:DNA mismatch repair protein MutL